MTSPEYLDPQYADGLMRKAVVTGDFILASGVRSNAKFDFDLIDTDSELFSRIVSGLSECIADNFTDFDSVLTVANGATRLGDPLSKLLEVPHIESSYTIDGTGKKIFTVSSPVIAKSQLLLMMCLREVQMLLKSRMQLSKLALKLPVLLWCLIDRVPQAHAF